MAVKEFRVGRKTAVTQFFMVKAANAAEARKIIEDEAERVWSKGIFSANWDLREEDVRDRRITDIGEAEAGSESSFFVRTKDWEPR